MKFTAVLYPEDTGGFPDRCLEIAGTISQGETREEALAIIREVIELIVDVRREDLLEEILRMRSMRLRFDFCAL